MSQDYPKISIITPSFNQAQFIDKAIQSVINQNYPNFEHIIFDNCSKDGTIDILKRYPHLVWISEPDKGQSEALNKGFKKATGELIGWLNADDLYLPNCFQLIADAFKKFPKSDLIYGDYRWIDQEGRLMKVRHEIDFDLFIYKYLHVPCFGSTAVFFKDTIFNDGNFLDPNYHYAMDYELLLRIALKGYHFTHIRKILADFRWHHKCKTLLNIKRQINEKERALFALDAKIQKIPRLLRPTMRFVLMLLARSKRTLIKIIDSIFYRKFLN